MITLSVNYYNPISQKTYDEVISNLQFHQLVCSCGHSGCLTIHAYYYRHVMSGDSKERLRICRVKCAICGHTHALLLSVLVPYSQIPLSTHVEIVSRHLENKSFSSIMDSTPSIDENNIRYIVRQYLRHWKQMLLSESIPLKPPLSQFVKRCFDAFSRQFMQIKRTPNIFFP
ncbi:DUF6431 domain-containing protein [Dehalobacterium formicoaceticum]|uniref:DUF6431 domain-containing protein n=1 Tax=Dehalobacterium formicoaceticum TaxID=51515 RepID=UPI003B836DB4